MKRQFLHLLVDIALFIHALGLLTTGLLIYFVLPHGSRQASVWGWQRHDWGELHFWLAMVMLALIVLHLCLNWTWVCQVFRKLCQRDVHGRLKRSPLIVGMGTLVAVVLAVGGFLFAANAARQPDSRQHLNTAGTPSDATDRLHEGQGSLGQGDEPAQRQGRARRLRELEEEYQATRQLLEVEKQQR